MKNAPQPQGVVVRFLLVTRRIEGIDEYTDVRRDNSEFHGVTAQRERHVESHFAYNVARQMPRIFEPYPAGLEHEAQDGFGREGHTLLFMEFIPRIRAVRELGPLVDVPGLDEHESVGAYECVGMHAPAVDAVAHVFSGCVRRTLDRVRLGGSGFAGHGHPSAQVALPHYEIDCHTNVISVVRTEAERQLSHDARQSVTEHVDFLGLLVPVDAPHVVWDTLDRYELEAELNVRDVQREPITPVSTVVSLSFIIRTSG